MIILFIRYNLFRKQTRSVDIAQIYNFCHIQWCEANAVTSVQTD